MSPRWRNLAWFPSRVLYLISGTTGHQVANLRTRFTALLLMFILNLTNFQLLNLSQIYLSTCLYRWHQLSFFCCCWIDKYMRPASEFQPLFPHMVDWFFFSRNTSCNAFLLKSLCIALRISKSLKVLQSPSGLDCKALLLYFVFNQIYYALDIRHIIY